MSNPQDEREEKVKIEGNVKTKNPESKSFFLFVLFFLETTSILLLLILHDGIIIAETPKGEKVSSS